ncbi:MAG TPA: phospho-N-acetylmuramoyl-pentapeptide-transferase [candidate division Zixibacteria bacterium]|nr:phospho-N-acetylmuramoyl-pentapeptide-transferase [candidate division Zixibacteria bacterium]
MLFNLLHPLKDSWIGFNLLGYLTFRIAAGTATSLAIAFLIGPPIIRFLRRKHIGDPVREDTPEHHQKKKGTPSMGGIIMVLAFTISTLLWADLRNMFVWLALGGTFLSAVMGFMDDYLKIVKGHRKGLLAREKLIGQILLGLTIGAIFYFNPPIAELRTVTELPFIKNIHVNFGHFYIIWIAFVITSSSNAINLTDGLDGLATGLSGIVAAFFTMTAYVVGRVDFTNYLNFMYLPGAGELAVFGGAIVGATLGFLWFNGHPAKVFMGDTGALALGAAFGTIAILIKKEFLLIIVGGVFVVETLSVIIQVASFKSTGKRVFKMTPIHHHFELMGWPENLVVTRFWILGIICALMGLAMFKVR